jgi:hypothetical protein
MEEINAKADIEVGAVSGGKPEIAPLVRIFSIGNFEQYGKSSESLILNT